MLLATAPVVLVPLLVFGLGVRRTVTERLTAQYRRRVDALVAVIREDLDHQSRALAGQLDVLRQNMTGDNRLRLALQGSAAERGYLLDYSGPAMRVAGLQLLQLQDDQGRILSSGHFRNEFDRLDPALPRLLATAPGGLALVRTRTAEGSLVALARVDSLSLAGREYPLVGGVEIDSVFLGRLARDTALTVAVRLPDVVLASHAVDSTAADEIVGEVAVPFVDDQAGHLVPAAIVVTHPLIGLAELKADVDRWFLVAVLGTVAVALLVAGWLSSRLSRPLATLADRATAVDLERLDTTFPSERDDEVGALARVLTAMVERLRAGAARLRDIERRAAMGELARQVNHDIKNGLAPLRHVLRHLASVAKEQPAELAAVFEQRRQTLDAGLAYLETLAANYAKLSPQAQPARCELNAVVSEAAGQIVAAAAELRLELHQPSPVVRADPLLLRRILDNLVTNAVESLEGRAGTVTISTARANGHARLVVRDTGKGMTRPELDRAFDDFHSTKPGGTGLGLSIVRRLVLDASGEMRVETEPGTGTSFILEFPDLSGEIA
jgi:signal transduction histidine kinase